MGDEYRDDSSGGPAKGGYVHWEYWEYDNEGEPGKWVVATCAKRAMKCTTGAVDAPACTAMIRASARLDAHCIRT